MNLSEKYRPKTLDQVIGQPKAIEKIKRMLARPGFDRDAWFVQGPSGVGKTTIARIIGSMLANDPVDVIELDGERCSIDAVREVAKMMSLRALSGGFRVFIINEAHAMTDRAVQAWLTTLEPLPPKVMVIFTTTEDDDEKLFGTYTKAFLDRCKRIRLTNQGLTQVFPAWLQNIAITEGLDGKPLSAYVALFKDCKNSPRGAIQRIEACEMME